MESAKAFLVNAKKALIDVEEKKKDINVLKGKKATYEEKVAGLNKAKNEIIEKTIKERRQDLDKDFDDRFTNIKNRINEAKAKREKERKKNINMLIEKETNVKRNNNIFLQNEIKRILKEKKVSRLVNTKFYLSVFKASNIGEFLRALLWFLCCFVLVPVAIILYLRVQSIWVIILIAIFNASVEFEVNIIFDALSPLKNSFNFTLVSYTVLELLKVALCVPLFALP